MKFILVIILVWFYRRVMLPLRTLATTANRLSQGDFAALAQSYGGTAEIDALRHAMNAMVGHVRRAQAQEHTYIEALTNGQEAERARIARDLHDDTTQSLVAIAQNLEIAYELLPSDSPARPMLKATRRQAVETVDNLRRLIANLRPPILAELGLVPALHVLSEGTPTAKIQIEVGGTPRRLNEMKELALFRSVQEAMWNALRHGQATIIIIRVIFLPDTIQLSIQDNGLGFDLPADLNDLATQGHYGLVGIYERIQHLGGTLQITTQDGVCIEIELPIQGTIQPDNVVRDPVCSAILEPNQAYSSLDYKGHRYYFCCPVCEGAFQTNPEVYLRTHNVG